MGCRYSAGAYNLTTCSRRYKDGTCQGRADLEGLAFQLPLQPRRNGGFQDPHGRGTPPPQGSPENRACKTGKGKESIRKKMSDKGALSAILYVLPQIRRYRGRPGNHLVGTMPSIKSSGLRSSRRPIRHGRNYGPLGIAT